jgi:hypothetical protein
VQPAIEFAYIFLYVTHKSDLINKTASGLRLQVLLPNLARANRVRIHLTPLSDMDYKRIGVRCS